jgi:hypothetical protein
MRFFKPLMLLCAFSLAGLAQTTVPTGPIDCIVTFNIRGGNGIAQIDNRSTGCDQWTIVYSADDNLSGYALAFQYATGITAPGTYMAYPSTNVSNSSSMFGTADNGLATYCNLATCGSGFITLETPWVQVVSSGASGTGSIIGTLYGYRTGYTGGTGGSGGGGGGGGCAGTASTPCIVAGPDAQGAAPTKNPVLVAGYDGSGVQRLQTDPTGHLENNQQGAGSFSSGQQSVTASAVALSPIAASRNVLLCALSTNTISIFIGSSGLTTSNGLEIPPGQCRGFYLGNTDLVYVIASTTGATISWGFTD